MSKYDDCHRVDNRYTTAIGMSVWRFFNIGKYKKYTKGLLHASMIGGVTAYLVLDKKHKLDTLDDFWNKVSTSTLPLYTSGRNRLLSVRGQDKQKVVTDLWNKYISSKENIRVNITSAIIFK